MIRILLAALAVSALLCSPALAARPLGATGVLMGHAGTSSPPAYDPGGVLFWQEASATYTVGAGNLNAGTDTRHGIIAFRRMIWLGTPNVQGPNGNFRSSSNFGTYGAPTCSTEGCAGFMINADAASWTVDGVGFTLRNTLAGTSDGSPPNPSSLVQDLDYAKDFKWQSVVEVYNTNAAAGSRKVAVWLDGVLQVPSNFGVTDTGAAFDVNWNTTRGLCINYCNRGSGLQFGGALMLSDVIVDTTNSLGTCDPATPGSAACLAIVAAFYSSGPVNPGSNSSNCTAFVASYSGGSSPDMCLRGDKSNFLANTGGTAHVMTVVNGVAGSTRTTGNGGSVLYDAPYGQGNEPTDRPYRAWVAPLSASAVTNASTSAPTSAGVTGNVMGNFGGEIKSGDRLFIAWLNCPSGATTPSATLPTISAGWSAVASSTSANPSNDSGTNPRCQWAVWTHVASADYVAVNVPWQTGNPFVDPPTITYGSNGVAPLGVYWLMMDYRSANATVNIDTSDFTRINQADSGASANLVTPTITTTNAPDTMVSLCMTRSSARPTNPPATTSLSTIQTFSGSALPVITAADEKLTSSGSTGTRTYFTTATPSANERAFCGLIALKNN